MKSKTSKAPLWALALLIIVPFWAPEGSDLAQAYAFYSTWPGKLLVGVMVATSALAIHFCISRPGPAAGREHKNGWLNWPVLAYCAFYTALFSTLAVLAYLRFHSDVDYANFLQSFHSAAHGRFFTNCLANAPNEISIFADHNSPIMFLILPIYLILPFPSVLLVISTLVLASTALILSRYLRELVGLDHFSTLCICAAATLAPYYASQNFQGLSMEMFGPPLFILALYFFEKGRFWPFMGTLLVLNSVKEQVAIVMMVFVIVSLIRRKSLKWIVGPLLLNGAMILISFGLVIPHFRPSGAYKLLDSNAAMSLKDQVVFYLKEPGASISQILEPFRLTYLYILAASNLFFLPFLSLESLFIIPSLAKNLLFVGWAANIMSKHALLLSGAMAVAVGKAIGRLGKRAESADDPNRSLRTTRVLAILLLGSSLLHTPVWFRNIDLSKDANHEARVQLLDIIPKEAPIALPQNMLTRFCTRNKLYNSATPLGIDGFDRPVDYVVIDTGFHPEHYDYDAFLSEVKAAGGSYKGFELVWEKGELYLFERKRQTGANFVLSFL